MFDQTSQRIQTEWRNMLLRSFEPREWFFDNDPPTKVEDEDCTLWDLWQDIGGEG